VTVGAEAGGFEGQLTEECRSREQVERELRLRINWLVAEEQGRRGNTVERELRGSWI
jgi:hypothetical protein